MMVNALANPEPDADGVGAVSLLQLKSPPVAVSGPVV
jgi:hypothetical protein